MIHMASTDSDEASLNSFKFDAIGVVMALQSIILKPLIEKTNKHWIHASYFFIIIMNPSQYNIGIS